MTIWRMRIACCIPKATNTHSEYVTLIAFRLQQWLHERAPMLWCTYCTLPVLSCISLQSSCPTPQSPNYINKLSEPNGLLFLPDIPCRLYTWTCTLGVQWRTVATRGCGLVHYRNENGNVSVEVNGARTVRCGAMDGYPLALGQVGWATLWTGVSDSVGTIQGVSAVYRPVSQWRIPQQTNTFTSIQYVYHMLLFIDMFQSILRPSSG